MTQNSPADGDGGVDQLADADKLSQALHDLRVAKKEIDNYHAGGKIAVAITKIEEVREEQEVSADA